jgi:hypothetical protein
MSQNPSESEGGQEVSLCSPPVSSYRFAKAPTKVEGKSQGEGKGLRFTRRILIKTVIKGTPQNKKPTSYSWGEVGLFSSQVRTQRAMVFAFALWLSCLSIQRNFIPLALTIRILPDFKRCLRILHCDTLVKKYFILLLNLTAGQDG